MAETLSTKVERNRRGMAQQEEQMNLGIAAMRTPVLDEGFDPRIDGITSGAATVYTIGPESLVRDMPPTQDDSSVWSKFHLA